MYLILWPSSYFRGILPEHKSCIYEVTKDLFTLWNGWGKNIRLPWEIPTDYNSRVKLLNAEIV